MLSIASWYVERMQGGLFDAGILLVNIHGWYEGTSPVIRGAPGLPEALQPVLGQLPTWSFRLEYLLC